MQSVLAFEKTKWLEFTKVKWAAPKISSGPKRDQTHQVYKYMCQNCK